MASADLRDELLCSICLSIFKDPVTLRCGHNFCQVCIDRVLDTQDESGVFSCPECRDEFQERPALMRNINHNVAERFLITQQEQEEITGICCTYCVDSPVPAVRSCLHCEASLCEKHLRAHSKSPEHVLSDPSTSLEKRKCPVHKKILEYYCTEDAACICVSCSLIGKHNEHKMESLDEASEKKKKKLRNVLQKLTTKREETEERVRSLEERRRKAQEKAAGEAERVTALCTDIRRRVDDLEKKVLSEISMREKQKSMSLSVVIHKLEIKKDELSRKMRHIEELCNMTDPLTVLQEPDTGDLCDFEEEGGDEDTGGHDKQLHDGGDLDVAVISHTLHTLCEVITGIRSGIYVEDPADILLDVNSAGNYVLISDDLKTVTWAEEEQNRPETAERFLCNQVMSRRGFTSGRHYWDVEGSGSGWWRVGMCYPSIDRKESQSLIGAMASADLNDELLCSICLSIFKDPVTLRCGHNFCRVCIDRALDTQDGSGVYSCPECREEFQERPALMRNLYLHNVTERFMITQQEQKITGIYCTYCVDSPVPAVRSCLHCEASLCEKHLRTHSKSPEHVLSDPSTSLEKRKCSVHKKILEYYCTEDAACICVSCSLIGKHKGHKMESLDEASEKKKKKLSNVLQKLTTKREKTEERVRSLKERWRKAQEKAAGEAERVTALCTDIRRLVDDLEKKVLSEISRQEKEESRSLSALIKLEIKKDELSRKMRHIEELCNMTDPLTVLQEPDTGDLCDPEEEGGDEDTGGHDKQLHDGDDLDVTVISHTLHTLCEVITGIRRGIYVEDPADILLDVNTAGNDLLISDDLKTATWTQNNQNRPETAERFQYNQVMSRRGFTSGRHYWDVEGSRSGGWSVGMCYPSIDRRGEESLIGNNNKSWSLRRYNNQYSVIHDSIEIQLPNKISSDRVRICLDYGAGQLSFYELCDPIRHLHTFTAAFSEPLHAALCVFWMYNDGHYIDSWVKIRT
ncbi:LOW QUALITY PROTEIN: E3 ubiquitin/ISG15 ligase TRIM25-like [Anomaloglossus baeobatrachus]